MSRFWSTRRTGTGSSSLHSYPSPGYMRFSDGCQPRRRKAHRDHLPPGSTNAIYSDPTGGPMTTQSRRRLLQALAVGTAAYTVPGLYAEALKTTVSLGEGPFYPDKMPLDTDNDLLVVNEGITPAVGEVAYVAGRVLTKS